MRCAPTATPPPTSRSNDSSSPSTGRSRTPSKPTGSGPPTRSARFGDRALPIAGPGAPLVSEFALMEYAAALGLSTDSGKAYVGKTLELRYRLPRLWEQVVTGRVPVWRAMRVAEHTLCLPMAAAAEVDRALAPAAGTCSWAQIGRLVEEALARHDPARGRGAPPARRGRTTVRRRDRPRRHRRHRPGPGLPRPGRRPRPRGRRQPHRHPARRARLHRLPRRTPLPRGR